MLFTMLVRLRIYRMLAGTVFPSILVGPSDHLKKNICCPAPPIYSGVFDLAMRSRFDVLNETSFFLANINPL